MSELCCLSSRSSWLMAQEQVWDKKASSLHLKLRSAIQLGPHFSPQAASQCFPGHRGVDLLGRWKLHTLREGLLSLRISAESRKLRPYSVWLPVHRVTWEEMEALPNWGHDDRSKHGTVLLSFTSWLRHCRTQRKQFALAPQGTWVRSLVGALRSHMLWSS